MSLQNRKCTNPFDNTILNQKNEFASVCRQVYNKNGRQKNKHYFVIELKKLIE